MTRAVTPASPIVMLSMTMVGRLQWFHRLVSLAMVLVEDALAYFNFLSSFTYVIWLISTLKLELPACTWSNSIMVSVMASNDALCGKLCFFAFIWISYFSTGLEFSRIPAAVSKGLFADLFFFWFWCKNWITIVVVGALRGHFFVG